MKNLLLELLSEEIPAFMQLPACDSLEASFRQLLSDAHIEFSKLILDSSCRRISLYAEGLPDSIPEQIIQIRGPKVQSSEAAVNGFLRSNNILYDQLKIQDSYYIYSKTIPGTKISDLLKEILPKAISSIFWRKSMNKNESETRWVRPLHNILCILDKEVINFGFAGLETNRITYGHRLTSNSDSYQGKEIVLKSADYESYINELKKEYVIVKREERKERIIKNIEISCNSQDNLKELDFYEDKELLEEVAGLVEYPVSILINIREYDSLFYELPNELVKLTARTHQKYFTCYVTRYKNEEEIKILAPFAVSISNNFFAEKSQTVKKTISQGNEKVLAARLKDALFRYRNDLKDYENYLSEELDSTKDQILQKMRNKIFHEGLGSILDKQNRLAGLLKSFFNGDTSPIADIFQQNRASPYTKCDLVSDTVEDYPELQGIIGSYLFSHINKKLKSSEPNYNLEIVEIIKEHYKPINAEDELPSNPGAALLSLFDKLDSLVGFMGSGLRATSSSDPRGLRRLAIAIYRLITKLSDPSFVNSNHIKQRLSHIPTIIESVILEYKKCFINFPDQLKKEASEFILNRIKQEYKSRYKESVQAIESLDYDGCDPLEFCTKLDLLHDLKIDFISLLSTYKRIIGLLGDFEANPNHLNIAFREQYDRHMFDLLSNKIQYMTQLTADRYLLELSSNLEPDITSYLNKITINIHDDRELTEQRKNILFKMRKLFSDFLDFDKFI